ncbi:MAG: tetratricopeptide repeat protein [Phycisphaerae bacterium]|nr:tetratricopeptide repeat protein [Phycisphaerae bacterium]
MRRATIPFLTAVLLLGLCASAVHAKSAAELLREGLYAEEVEGNLDSAIGIYQQIILDTTAPKNLVAQALYRQGMCSMKKRDEAKAREVFQKLVNDYPDQTEIVEKARPVLEGLGNADPASLMPPETILYVEIGTPGQQVATILNMLKGTPVENPFNIIGMKNDSKNAGGGQKSGGQNPVQMLNALLNPSMLAELQKVRGIGVGIQDVTKNNPPAIIVLYPGKSDALRGLLQMALSGLGKPADAIGGMSSVTFGDGGGAAFDDTVVILATPSPKGNDLLQWAVRQYKGAASQPSLASGNKSFSKISKQARQQNALTLWLNVDETYARLTKMLPADQIPQQIRLVDGLVDLKNIDDMIATLSLRETGLALEANIGFKPGYQSTAYSMIHTPNLKKADLKAIPAEAVALLSLTLGAAGTPQAQAASDKIQSATGLDLGSQIFGNIEQISLFVVPPKESVLPQGPEMPPIARSIGLAITSQDPAKTQKLLMSVLQMANLVAADGQQAPPATGRYEIALGNGMKIFGYASEANKTTVLSLNAQLVEQSVTAAKTDGSVLSGGSLQDALATLSPTTSKLVVINVGAALQIAEQNSQFSSDEAAQKAKQSMDELSKASQKTTIRLLTNESTNSFGIRLSVSDLPPVRQLFGPITQLVQMVSQSKAQMGHTQAKAQAALSIPSASRAPAIDGNVDDAWAGVPSQAISHVAYTAPDSEADLSANFKTMYDSQALYILVDVTDDHLIHDSAEYWLDDGVEVFLAADNNKSDVYGDKDYQYHFDWDSTAPALGESHHNKTNGVQYAFARTDKGCRLEAKLPWSTLGTTPAAGKKIGLDVHVNDDDNGGDRDTKIMWFGEHDVAWQQPSAFGTAELAGLVGWWKLDESEGTKAADSSGNGHNATVRGNPKWQPSGGKIGGAIALSGNGDCLEVADESAFDATAGVTVAAWIKANALDKPWQAIVTKGEGAWRIQRNNETSTLEFACTGVRIPGGNEYGSLLGNKAITLGEWHHIAGVYDGKKMYIYVDGVLDTSQEASGPIGTDDNPVLIGENGQFPGRFWNGLIDEVRVYNFGLPEAQIQQLYREGK